MRLKPPGRTRRLAQRSVYISLLHPFTAPPCPAALPSAQLAAAAAGQRAVAGGRSAQRHLTRLDLIGDAMHVDWEDRHGTHALRLTCRRTRLAEAKLLNPFWPNHAKHPDHVPAGVDQLRAATQLSSLHLSCLWSNRCAELLTRLTALRDFRCVWVLQFVRPAALCARRCGAGPAVLAARVAVRRTSA